MAPTGASPTGEGRSRFIRRLDAICGRVERILGLYGAAALVGLVLLAAAAVYVTPALTTINHGNRYRVLSIDPYTFGVPNDMQLRILTPLVAHFLFLRGAAYIFLPLLTGAGFLAAVYAWSRRRGGLAGGEAAGVAALMAFSTPILFVLHFQGYVDTTSYLLVFLTLAAIDKAWLWPVFYALALLNHESNLFVAPLLLVAANLKSLRLSRSVLVVVLVGLAVVPAAAYRHYVELHAPVVLGLEAYPSWSRVEHSLGVIAKNLPMGIFYAFRLFWLLPLVALAQHGRRRDVAGMAFVVVGFLCATGQLLLATDTSRLLGLAFPIVLFGALSARERWGESFGDRLWKLIGLNFLVLPYYVGQGQVLPLLPLPISLALWFVRGIDPWSLWWGDGY